MRGFNYSEPDDSGTKLTAVRAGSGLFYIQASFDDHDESTSVAVKMSPTDAEALARWILASIPMNKEL